MTDFRDHVGRLRPLAADGLGEVPGMGAVRGNVGGRFGEILLERRQAMSAAPRDARFLEEVDELRFL